jgi:translation initiation factor IF-2
MADSGRNRPNRPIRPRESPTGRRKRRVVIDTQAGRPRPDARQARDRPAEPRPKPREVAQPTGPVTVPSGVTVRDLSQALGVPAAQLIKFMMGLGEMVQITQSLTDDAVQLIAAEVGREINIAPTRKRKWSRSSRTLRKTSRRARPS